MKRYTIWCAASHGHQPMESDNGQMLTYADAIAFTRRVAEAAWNDGLSSGFAGNLHTPSEIQSRLDFIIAEAEKSPSG